MLAAVLGVANVAVSDVVDDKPAPGAVVVLPDDAGSRLFGGAGLGVGGFKVQGRCADLILGQADLLGNGAEVLVNVAVLVAMGQKVGENEDFVGPATERARVERRENLGIHGR